MINKQLIMYNFNKAANQYLHYADIQKNPALKIHSLIENQLSDSLFVLDLGSGPGTFSHLKKPIVNTNIILYDLSLSMLKYAANNHHCGNLINGDAELLPFKDSCFNLIISNLMFQWINNKRQALNEISRIMLPGGTFVCSSLITPSLWQLKNAWATIDNKNHALNFLNRDEYKILYQEAGFEIIQLQQWSNTLFFASYYELLYHFKNTGTNIPKNDSRGLGGINLLKEISKSYEKFRTNEGLPLTYEYILIYGKKL